MKLKALTAAVLAAALLSACGSSAASSAAPAADTSLSLIHIFLAQFCTAYVRILSQNELVATGVTGKVVHDACGLPVRCLYPGCLLYTSRCV